MVVGGKSEGSVGVRGGMRSEDAGEGEGRRVRVKVLIIYLNLVVGWWPVVCWA
jgi:hypothetical protein